MFTNFIRRFFSIGISIGDKVIVGCKVILPIMLRESRDMILFYLSVLPHVLLFVATLGFSKAIMDMIQERREKRVLIARITERQRIEEAYNKKWAEFHKHFNVYDPKTIKAYNAYDPVV